MTTFLAAKLYDDAKLPERAHDTDIGLDLFSYGFWEIAGLDTLAIPTGIVVEIPRNHGGFVTPRSGLALKGITVANSPGLIDPGYRGEVKVLLFNSTMTPYIVDEGDKIAQLVIWQAGWLDPVEVDKEKLSNTERGSEGFGSTGN